MKINWTKVRKWAFTAAGAATVVLPHLAQAVGLLQAFHAPQWLVSGVGAAAVAYQAFKQDPAQSAPTVPPAAPESGQ